MTVTSPVAVQYPGEMWTATLRQPKGVVGAGGTIAVVADVVGNIDLAGVPVHVRLEPRHGRPHGWLDGMWQTTDKNRGTVVAHTVNVQAGRYDVIVRPTAGRQSPHVPAGRFIAQ